MKGGFWTADWFAGLLVTLVILFIGFVFQGFHGLELAAYDMGVRHSSTGSPNRDIAIIAIDDRSLENLGRWPWPRNYHAELINTLSLGQPRLIASTVTFAEPQIDPGLDYIRAIIDQLEQSSLLELEQELQLLEQQIASADKKLGKRSPLAFRQLTSGFADSRLRNEAVNDLGELASTLLQAESDLNTDAALTDSIQNIKVILNMYLFPGETRGNPDQQQPKYVMRNSLANIQDRVNAFDNGLLPQSAVALIPPIPEFGEHAAAIGYMGMFTDIDGDVRSDALVMQYWDSFFPSMSLMIAAQSLNLGPGDIQINLGESVNLGQLTLDTDTGLLLRTYFYQDDRSPAFTVDSFFDVLTGNIPAEKYRGKIVLIGPTAAGTASPQVTPISNSMAPVQVLAHQVSSILNEDYYIQPAWDIWIRLLATVLVAAYLIAVLPRLRAAPAALSMITFALILFGTEYLLLTTQSLWVQLMMPLSLLIIGYLLLVTKRFLVTEQGKIRSEADSAESNRMLGLAFQGQGQLDMAFDKYRKVPRGPDVMELLYNLALDYERKRQFNKAHSVYQYMHEYDPDFRDLEKRMQRSLKMEETVMLGGSSGAGNAFILDAEGVEKPMLGRYEIDKELGKGAMGVVYLGKDPKINRTVAIKTMALSQEFEADELEGVKTRFFREAETAGRLNHPNIVTIYDAGEEHDLAYIAMEFLKGRDLMRFTKPDKLLNPLLVMNMIGKCADALNYAHELNVVHRDIKPANVMYDTEEKTIKLTDFGIARITDSSKTKTGMVLGTPSYMSPEQLAGKKVDGRSDLFSLGVMFFQLLTGRLPFQAESMATLMYKIANEEHPEIGVLRPELPTCIGPIIDKMLQKDVEQRYQTGAEVINDIKRCLIMIKKSANK